MEKSPAEEYFRSWVARERARGQLRSTDEAVLIDNLEALLNELEEARLGAQALLFQRDQATFQLQKLQEQAAPSDAEPAPDAESLEVELAMRLYARLVTSKDERRRCLGPTQDADDAIKLARTFVAVLRDPVTK